jgi:NADH dehydrogenase FAD-containing subunit
MPKQLEPLKLAFFLLLVSDLIMASQSCSSSTGECKSTEEATHKEQQTIIVVGGGLAGMTVAIEVRG